MPKKRKSAVSQRKHDVSASDSETEHQRPKKLIKRNRNNIQFSSTPHSNSLSFNCPASTSNGNSSTAFEDIPSDCNYANFTSFLESHSFISDDESDLLTVSNLAEMVPSTSFQNVSRKSIIGLSNSFQNASLEFSPDKPKILAVPCKNLDVVCVQHPTTLTLHGYVKVTVLVGTASVLGYNVAANHEVRVFSSKRSGYKKIMTQPSVVRICQNTLHRKLTNITEISPKGEAGKLDIIPDESIKNFVDCIGSFSVVFVLQKSSLPPPLQFMELYFPNAVEMDIPKKDASGSDMFSTIDLGVIEVSPEAKLIADHLNKDFLKTGPRIVVHGASKSGKSTMLRYLINTVLNTHSEVYYLDADPGQTEFTPPGVVSLIKVTKPLLGPPYSHCRQKKPIRMIFTGSITPATSPSMYNQCVRSLIEYFEDKFNGNVLFVNTMGWVEGIGEMCFQTIKAVIKPTMLIDFISPNECPNLKIEETQDESIHVEVPIIKYPSLSSYSPKDMREFAIMSYFGKCQKYYLKPVFLNEFTPFCVKWNDIAIAVMGKKIGPDRLVEAIHCSFVALCRVDESLIVESADTPEYPKSLQEEAFNECLGFGLVRAVDEINRLLYIVTPLSLKKLKKVNALIKGNIMIPEEVYFKQPIYNTSLPYTAESKIPPASIKKNVKKRQFIPQQTPKNH